MFTTCPKGHKRNKEIKQCPECKFGKPINFKSDIPEMRRLKRRRWIGQGTGGGPKFKAHTCPKCKYVGFAIRNPKGNSANCFKCKKRIY